MKPDEALPRGHVDARGALCRCVAGTQWEKANVELRSQQERAARLYTRCCRCLVNRLAAQPRRRRGRLSTQVDAPHADMPTCNAIMPASIAHVAATLPPGLSAIRAPHAYHCGTMICPEHAGTAVCGEHGDLETHLVSISEDEARRTALWKSVEHSSDGHVSLVEVQRLVRQRFPSVTNAAAIALAFEQAGATSAEGAHRPLPQGLGTRTDPHYGVLPFTPLIMM